MDRMYYNYDPHTGKRATTDDMRATRLEQNKLMQEEFAKSGTSPDLIEEKDRRMLKEIAYFSDKVEANIKNTMADIKNELKELPDLKTEDKKELDQFTKDLLNRLNEQNKIAMDAFKQNVKDFNAQFGGKKRSSKRRSSKRRSSKRRSAKKASKRRSSKK